MTKSREKKTLPLLGKLKEGIHLIGKKGKELICIVRKVKFKEPNLSVTGQDKYKKQRYSLFSKYDEGILMDNESWFSVTHEAIANHIAKTCKKCQTVMDGFSGVGGNVIAFAKHCRVLAIEIDQTKLDMLKNNAKIYEVEQNIETLNLDFLKFPENKEKIDVVFASPPWGGPDYIASNKYEFSEMTPCLSKILEKCAKLCSSFIIYLPKNLDPIDLYKEIRRSKTNVSKIELQVYYINKKVKAIACFCGDIVRPVKSHVSYLTSIN